MDLWLIKASCTFSHIALWRIHHSWSQLLLTAGNTVRIYLIFFDPISVICEVFLSTKQLLKIIVIGILVKNTGLVMFQVHKGQLSGLSFGSFIFSCICFDFSWQDAGVWKRTPQKQGARSTGARKLTVCSAMGLPPSAELGPGPES